LLLQRLFDQEFFFSGNNKENKTAIAKENTKLASLSETPVEASKKFFQITVETVPDIREANTPALLKRFQNKINSNAGPNEDPIPDHA
jgi:hypothetical protein